MPGCAAIGCNNRSEKGYTMKCFPRDPRLRNIWKQRVGRADWEPSNNSFLCHVHFEANQWVVTPGGRVKLKKGAVPSIFTVTSTRKSPKKRQKLGSQELVEEDDNEEYEIEYLESDQPFILNLPNQNIVPNFINIQTQNAVIPSGQFLQNIKFVNSDALKDLSSENVIIVADENNREIGKIINDSSIIVLANDVGKENVQILPHPEKPNNPSRVKVEVKEEVTENGLSNHDYDEIERKLEEMYSGNETDSSNNVKYISKVNSQSIETASTFSLDDLENGVDSVNENSNQEPEPEITILRTSKKRKRKSRTESLNDDSKGETSQISNEIDDTQLSENISDIIQDVEVEKPAECSNVPTKSVSLLPAKPVQNSQVNRSNKPIIKNDIQLEFRSDIINRPVQIKKNNVATTSNKKPNELLTKLDLQGEVIELLTNQLIAYKDMDRQMKSMTQELESKNKQIELLNRRAATKKSSPAEKKTSKNDSLNSSDPGDGDWKSRIECLEEKNKNLMKTVTLETQTRRKLECQVKSRDNQIKELNWKLEKASKFLDRAEKNANTYRKKMLSMQALVRRKKLSHEKTSLFDEFLVGQTDQSYSENALKMALEIQKVCGTEGYQKLLEFEFPLPSLNDLHGSPNGSVHEVDGDEVILGSAGSESNYEIVSIEKVKVEKKEIVENNESERLKENDVDCEEVEYLDLELMDEPSETGVSGTVHDIFFNEDSEEDEEDPIKKHIMIDLADDT